MRQALQLTAEKVSPKRARWFWRPAADKRARAAESTGVFQGTVASNFAAVALFGIFAVSDETMFSPASILLSVTMLGAANTLQDGLMIVNGVHEMDRRLIERRRARQRQQRRRERGRSHETTDTSLTEDEELATLLPSAEDGGSYNTTVRATLWIYGLAPLLLSVFCHLHGIFLPKLDRDAHMEATLQMALNTHNLERTLKTAYAFASFVLHAVIVFAAVYSLFCSAWLLHRKRMLELTEQMGLA
jgi:hypothetical protein